MTTNWLNLTEESAIESDLPIIDPHHHLWERQDDVYLLDELLADVSEHNVRQTVFIECGSKYRADGPEELRVVGETEFVQQVARQSAARGKDEVRACTGIVGTADLTLGDNVTPVLEAHLEASPDRFRGIRHRAAWDAFDRLAVHTPLPHLLFDRNFREGYAHLERYGLSFEMLKLLWLYSHILNIKRHIYPDRTFPSCLC